MKRKTPVLLTRRFAGHACPQVWSHAQTRLSELVTHMSLPSPSRVGRALATDVLARLAAVVEDFVAFGETLTQRPALKLRGALDDVCRGFCAEFHGSALSTLHTALESDFWRPYPASANTAGGQLAALQEVSAFLPHALPQLTGHLEQLHLSHRRQSPPSGATMPAFLAPGTGATAVSGEGKVPSGTEARVNPFINYQTPKMQLPDLLIAVQEVAGDDHDGVMMTAGAIKAVRLLGEYLSLMALVPRVVTSAFEAASDLVRYYVFTVVDLFTPADTLASGGGAGVPGLLTHASPALSALLAYLEAPFPPERRLINCQVPLKSEDALYGVGERCACSLICLHDVMLDDPIVCGLFSRAILCSFVVCTAVLMTSGWQVRCH